MKTASPKTIVIVGGVAGGASCAARLRRMDETAEIIILERGPFASFANCGLPYFVGGVIEQEDDLIVANGPLFKDRFAIDLRTQHEVMAIDREARELATGHAPGARNLPLNTLRTRLGELSKQRPLAVYCAVGARGHNAVRLLRQHGFDAYNLSGGYTTFRHVTAAAPA